MCLESNNVNTFVKNVKDTVNFGELKTLNKKQGYIKAASD